MTNEAVQTAHSQRLVELMRGATWNGVSVDDLRARKSAVEHEYAEAVRQRDEAIALLRQAAGDFDYLVQMVMANDPKRINNGTKHRQNGIIAEVVAVGAQGGARARAFLSNFPEEDAE